MKRFIGIILSLIILLSCETCASEMFITSAQAYYVQYNEISYTYDDIDTLIELIEEQNSNMDAAHQMAEAARHLGYNEDHEVIQLAKKEHANANNLRKEYQKVHDNLMERWHQKEDKYPVATYIWSYLKDLGYSNQVCAGILGNMMTESGSNTLNICYNAQTSKYYGICQWNKTYYSDVWGASLEEQCNYLRDTIKYEIDTFGSQYNYDSFLKINRANKAALCFAKAYERCGSGTYTIRQQNAVSAYNYFIS